MADGRKNNGGKRDGAGRPSKVDEQKLIERLSPLQPKAFKALENAIQQEQSWAVKLYFEYMYGKPKQQMDITTKGESLRYTATERKERIEAILNKK